LTYQPLPDDRRTGAVYGRAGVRPRPAAGGPPPDGGDPRGPGGGGLPPAPRRGFRWGRLFLVLGILALVLVIGTVATAVHMFNKFDGQVKRVGDVFAALPQDERPAKSADGSTNILLVGFDSWKTSVPRSDTIMLVHLPADRKKAYLVSIPRDSWVPVPGKRRAKINSSFAWGGPTLLIQTIEKFTDVRIDHYAQVSFTGFEAMTDAVGGVDMPGAGHLDGKAALKYVRERKTLAHGDFDRIKRQQKFIKVLMSKSVDSADNPFKLTDLLDAASKAVSVDSGLTGGELRSLLLSARSIRSSSVVFSTAPTTGTGTVGDQSVVFLDKTAGVALWKAMREDRMADLKR
jgi:anionic cell wall polymer biosynthesis LytR-Cps2A-Psr (LCP) family protein